MQPHSTYNTPSSYHHIGQHPNSNHHQQLHNTQMQQHQSHPSSNFEDLCLKLINSSKRKIK